ncbi:MAG: sugar ABC transporter permease [Thermoprotei archaeon]|nr:MAG: sugar ABC transporter permease [Thermoprotei archaeon]
MKLSKRLLPWLFLTPLIFTIIFAWIAPMILTVYLSFTDLSIKNFLPFIENFASPKVKITLDNFEKIISRHDPYINEVIMTTAIYVSSVLFINAIYSLFLSICIAFFVKKEVISMFLRVSWLIPRIMPGIIYALMWNWFIDPKYGLMNAMLMAVGVPKEWLPSSWLLDKPYSLMLMIIVNGYVGASFGMIVYTAAIKSIPPDLINAARVDGASDFQVVKYIILPLLKWSIMFVTAWQTLSLLASYEQILMIWGAGGGGGIAGIAKAAGVMVWALYSYTKAFYDYEYGYASAISLIIVIVGVIVISLYFKIFGFKRMMVTSKIEV